MGKINSRMKGKRGELAACSAWREEGWEARRSQQFCGKGGESADILVEGLPLPLHIEVKAVEKLNLENAMSQARRDASPGSTPIVMHKRNHTPWKCTLLFTDLCSLLRADFPDETNEKTEEPPKKHDNTNSK
jgi:hypothetical protein